MTTKDQKIHPTNEKPEFERVVEPDIEDDNIGKPKQQQKRGSKHMNRVAE